MRLRELLVPKKQLALVWGQYTEKINPNEGTNTMRAELGGEDPPWAKARQLKKLASLPATSSVLSTHSSGSQWALTLAPVNPMPSFGLCIHVCMRMVTHAHTLTR